MIEVREGTLWRGSDEKTFRVLHVVEVDGHTWVHYRNEKCNPNTEDCKEYSCYIESFLQRFGPTPE